jgi:GGDEF domain-containing protein
MEDPSTYLLPEELFRFLLEKECRRAVRYAHFFSLLLVKLEISDLEDSLLSTIANLIQGVIRKSDIIGILQDKQIVVILHHSDADGTQEITVRIRCRIQGLAHRIPQIPESQNIRIMGACFPTHACNAEDLFTAAQEGP